MQTGRSSPVFILRAASAFHILRPVQANCVAANPIKICGEVRLSVGHCFFFLRYQVGDRTDRRSVVRCAMENTLFSKFNESFEIYTKSD